MFRGEDLKVKVSEFSLKDIIEMGATEEDYKIPDGYEDVDFNSPVVVKLDQTLISDSELLMRKLECSSNALFKSATKLGAMIIQDYAKILRDVWNFIIDVYEYSHIKDDELIMSLIQTYSNELAALYRANKPKYTFSGLRKKSLYPYPKWRAILDSLSWSIRCPKSEIYRGAISLAFSTEIKCRSSDEFIQWLDTIAKQSLDTIKDFCHKVKLYSKDCTNYIVDLSDKYGDSVRSAILSVLS